MIGPAVFGAMLALAAPVQGKLFSAVRYQDWYGGYSSSDGFNTNVVARRPYDSTHRVGAYWPSNSEVVLTDNLEFRTHDRPAQTYIFNGVVKVPACRSGVYKFRISADDATDMFLDGSHVLTNPGKKGGVSTMETAVHITPNTEHQFELWWGNYGGPTSLKVEYCFSSKATFEAKQAGALSSDEGAPSLEDVLGDVEADNSCVYSTDLGQIFIEQNADVPAIQRCDYKGFNNGWIGNLPSSTEVMINTACVLEFGGVIDMSVPKSLSKTSYNFAMNIKPRATGTHTFWTLSDDGSEIWIDGFENAIVANSGNHDDRSQQGSVYLKKGVTYRMWVSYGNDVNEGALKVHWTDPMTDQPQASFLPILEPFTN